MLSVNLKEDHGKKLGKKYKKLVTEEIKQRSVISKDFIFAHVQPNETNFLPNTVTIFDSNGRSRSLDIAAGLDPLLSFLDGIATGVIKLNE